MLINEETKLYARGAPSIDTYRGDSDGRASFECIKRNININLFMPDLMRPASGH